MTHYLFSAILICVALVSLFRPWIGVVCAYLMVVLQPQAVWFWAFEGVRPELWVLVPTGIGIMLGLLRREFDLSILASKRNLCFLILWGCFALSYYLGSYTQVLGPNRFEDADTVFALTTKMMLLYFMAALSIDSERKLKALYAAVCVSAVYLIYWGNDQYFSGRLHGGRLAGPTDVKGGGIYHDENAFSMLFVVAQAFLWYVGLGIRKPLWRWSWWLIIPFCWHAVFLTASRGGLIGLGVTILLITLRSKKRLFGFALIPAFIFVLIWQGGGLMKTRAGTIADYQQDSSAESRLQAWHAASRMIVSNPLIGVGLASFGPAFSDYSADRPREAHNTVLQITAESGIPAGLMYLSIVTMGIVSLWKLGNKYRRNANADELPNRSVQLISEATLVGLCGLVSCSMFLSLQVFEIFYLLNVLANTVIYLDRAAAIKVHDLEDVIGRAVRPEAVGPAQ